MKDSLAALFKDKKQRPALIWLLALCMVAAVAVLLLLLCLFNEDEAPALFSWAMKGKKLSLAAAAFTALVIACLGLWQALRRTKRAQPPLRAWPRWLALFLAALVVSFVLNLAGEIAIKGLLPTLAWLPGGFTSFLRSWLWLFLIYLVLAGAATHCAAALVTGAVTVIPGIISYFKLAYRGNPVFPWDIYALSTFADISDGIELELTLAILAALALWALAVVAVIPLRFAWPWRARRPAKLQSDAEAALPPRTEKQRGLPVPLRRGLSLLCAALLLGGYTYAAFFSASFSLPVSGWSADAQYKKSGQLTAFLTDIKMLSPKQPAGYSRSAVEGIVAEAPQSAVSEAEAAPNIIMVMGESFWDVPAMLPGVQFEEELLPNLRRLQQEAVSGNLLVSVFGGGTSTTEFQALTGFSTQFFAAEYTPYFQAVRGPFFSYAQYLKNQGYATLAVHGHYGKGWNRTTAYPYMGFDAFYYLRDEQGSFADMKKERARCSDASMVDEMIRRYEEQLAANDAPVFLFGVTMQNHPSYRSGRYKEEKWFPFTAPGASEESIDQLRDIATGMHSADAALGTLIAYLETREEPMLLIYFGDHQSFNSGTAQQIHAELGTPGIVDSPLDWQMQLYQVPFAAWSNRENPVQSMGTIAAYNLLPAVLDAYGLPMPRFFDYLLGLSETSPGYENGLVLQPGGGYVWNGEGTPAQQQAEDAYEILQYDYIFGKRYARAFFADGTIDGGG